MGRNPASCTQCSMTFVSKAALKRHSSFCGSWKRRQTRHSFQVDSDTSNNTQIKICAQEEPATIGRSMPILFDDDNDDQNMSSDNKGSAASEKQISGESDVAKNIENSKQTELPTAEALATVDRSVPNLFTDNNDDSAVTLSSGESNAQNNQNKIENRLIHQTVARSNDETNKIAELNQLLFSSNDLQTLKDRNKELNNNFNQFIVQQQNQKTEMELNNDRNAAKIADLKKELSKALETAKKLRTQNADLMRSKAIAASHSQDLCLKLKVANRSIVDCNSTIAKLTVKNNELHAQENKSKEKLKQVYLKLAESHAKCAKAHLEMGEMCRANKKSLEEQVHRFADEKGRLEQMIAGLMRPRSPNDSNSRSKCWKLEIFWQKLCVLDKLTETLDTNHVESTLMEIERYKSLERTKSDAIEREKWLSLEKQQLDAEKMQLKNVIVELASTFEKHWKKHENYIHQLEKEYSSRIDAMVSEKRTMELKISSMANEIRFINEVIKFEMGISVWNNNAHTATRVGTQTETINRP